MQIGTQGRADCSRRHELDRLVPSRAVEAGPARRQELEQLAAIAQREIPGVNASAALELVLQADPETIFAFRRSGNVVGGIAFLFLNEGGLDALLGARINLREPEAGYLARANEAVSGMYVWALAGYGRAVMGLGSVAAHLRSARFVAADYYAQPSSKDGRDLLLALGFRPLASRQPDLWCYRRPWHRIRKTSTIHTGAGETVDAWH